MSLETVRGSANIPEGAVQITKEEAIKYQRNVIDNWPNVSEVFFLRYGKPFAMICTAFTAAACINVFHPILKFGKGTFTGVLPSILVPPAIVYYKTDTVLTDDLVSMKLNCTVCHHLKYLAFQLYSGFIFPSSFGLLSAHDGHNIPFNKDNATEYWKKAFQIGIKKMNVFRSIVFIQSTIAFLIPYAQNLELEDISKTLRENPEKINLEEILNT